jgi:nucleoid-associated protein YgaU
LSSTGSAAHSKPDAARAAKPAPRTSTRHGELNSAGRVPGSGTIDIQPGDNLWNISRSTYGSGVLYPRIYNENQDQIQDPDVIFPGQTLVVPGAAR